MINHSSCYTLLDKKLLIVIFCSFPNKHKTNVLTLTGYTAVIYK